MEPRLHCPRPSAMWGHRHGGETHNSTGQGASRGHVDSHDQHTDRSGVRRTAAGERGGGCRWLGGGPTVRVGCRAGRLSRLSAYVRSWARLLADEGWRKSGGGVPEDSGSPGSHAYERAHTTFATEYRACVRPSRRCWKSPYSLPRFSRALERRRPGHPRPERSQGRVREAAVAANSRRHRRLVFWLTAHEKEKEQEQAEDCVAGAERDIDFVCDRSEEGACRCDEVVCGRRAGAAPSEIRGLLADGGDRRHPRSKTDTGDRVGSLQAGDRGQAAGTAAEFSGNESPDAG